MKVALIYKSDLRIGDFRYSKFESSEDGIFAVINFDDGDFSKPMVVIQNPILENVDQEGMNFIDPKTGEQLKVVPFDNVSDCFDIKTTIELRKHEPQLPVPKDSEGDPNCKHQLEDDGDNFQIFCIKCEFRKSISFLDEDLNTPLDFC